MTYDKIPPSNGFMKYLRRLVAVLCLITFFGLIVAQFVLGVVAHAVPSWLYGMLFTGSLMMFDVVDNLVQKITGGVK